MREKRSRNQEKAAPLFDYNNLDNFDADESLTVDFDGLLPSVRASLEAAYKSDLHNFGRLQTIAKTLTKKENLPRQIADKDPLKPELFIGHHRRMEREERRMQVQERQGLMTTALRLRTQKLQLIGPEWLDYIDRIVRINDPEDYEELQQKRTLAIDDMTTFLEKFDEYHRRINRRESRPVPKKQTAPPVTKPQKAKPKPKAPLPKKPEEGPVYEPPTYNNNELTLFFRPFAFGKMVPARSFPPKEFALPPLLVSEVESYDLVDELAAKRSKFSK